MWKNIRGLFRISENRFDELRFSECTADGYLEIVSSKQKVHIAENELSESKVNV